MGRESSRRVAKAPPGWGEKAMLRLKREYPGQPEKAFATAWSLHGRGVSGEDYLSDKSSSEEGDREAVSPPGWGGTVEHMKEQDDIDNPWALCLGGDTIVPLLNGTEKTLCEMADICSSEPDAVFWVYSFNLAKDRVCVGRAHHARCTGVRSDAFKVLLDNGKKVVATSNHPWLLLDGRYVDTAHLRPGTRCMPLYRRTSLQPSDRMDGYEMVLQPRRLRRCGCGCGAFARPDNEFLAQHHRKLGSRGTYDRAKGIIDSGFLSFDDGYWQYTHKFAAGAPPGNCRNGKGQFAWGSVVHHKDFNKANNYPDNLKHMRTAEHAELHGKLARGWRDAGIIALREWRLKNPDLYHESLIRAGRNSKKGHAGLRRYNISKRCRARASRYSASGEQTKDWLKNICAKVLASGMPITSESWNRHKSVKNAPSFETALRYFGNVDVLIRETEMKHGLGVNHKVVSVERIESPMLVYDLTVDGTSNFGIGAGVFVHNSWWMSEQRGPGGKKKFHPRHKERRSSGMLTNYARMLDEIVSAVCEPIVKEAKKRQLKKKTRGHCVFPAESSMVTDDKDHFPINELKQAANALARVMQYDACPGWYKGSLKGLQAAVRREVYDKFPGLKKRKEKREGK